MRQGMEAHVMPDNRLQPYDLSMTQHRRTAAFPNQICPQLFVPVIVNPPGFIQSAGGGFACVMVKRCQKQQSQVTAIRIDPVFEMEVKVSVKPVSYTHLTLPTIYSV